MAFEISRGRVVTEYVANAAGHIAELAKLERAQRSQADSAVTAGAKTSNALGRAGGAFANMDISVTKALGGLSKFSFATIGLEGAFKLLTNAHKAATDAGAKWAIGLSSSMTSLQESTNRFAIALDPLLSRATSLLSIATDIVAVASGEWVDPETGKRYTPEDPAARRLRLAADRQALQDTTYSQSGSEVNRYLKILGGFSGTMTADQYAQLDKNQQSMARVIDENKQSQQVARDAVFEFAENVAEAAKRINDLIGDTWRGGALLNLRQPSGGPRGPDTRRVSQYAQRSGVDVSQGWAGSGNWGSAADGGGTSGIDLKDYADARVTERWVESIKNIQALTRANQKSALEGLFGPLSEFNAYQAGWQTLTDSVRGAYGAIVDGEGSTSAAIKNILKESLKSMGSRMLIRGLEEVAEGIAALANPNPVWGAKSAATHFLAAAKFGAGATAAGVAASGIGGGGAGNAAPVGGAGGYSGGGGGDGGRRTVYIVGSPHSDDTPRQRRQRLVREAKIATGGTAGGDY